MNIQGRLTDLKELKSYSIPAKRIMEHLKPILSKSNELQQRWAWELLQNASDLGNNVKARFELSSDKLIFSHNGKPFSLDEAYNLIMPDSTKDDLASHQKSVIGQFGTGFISTHILSKIIQIKGIIEDEKQFYSFDFNLDRSNKNDKEFLIQSIKESEDEFRENLKKLENCPENEFQTSFTYYIKNTYSSLDGQEIVNEGIESFKELISFVLTFRPQIDEIEIIDQRNELTNWTFKREEVDDIIENLIIIRTTCYKNGEYFSEKLTGNIIQENIEIAFPIQLVKEKVFKLLPFPKNYPVLFCAFPMIGTSYFNFPVIIHSEKFIPNRERDGIEISSYDTENRNRLIEAKNAFLKLLEIIETNEWTDTFNIFSLSTPEFNDNNTKVWFTNSIFNPIKNGLYNTKMVELDDSLEIEYKRCSLSDIYIPYADKRLKDCKDLTQTIYNFAFETIPTFLPKSVHFLDWFNAIDFEIFNNEKLDLEKLIEKISENIYTLEDFVNTYRIDETKAIQYLIKLIKFILTQDKRFLLDNYKLILNQNNQLCFLKGLRVDKIDHKSLNKGYDEKLKNIYTSLSNTSCRDILLKEAFNEIENLIDKGSEYKFNELARNTDEELRNFDRDFRDETFLLILKELFNWYTTCGLSDELLIKCFPYFSLNKSQLYLNTKTPQELAYSFDIEISGKSEVLARLANSSLSEKDLEIIANNTKLVSDFLVWLNNKQEDNPNKQLGNIGEEFVFQQLCSIFGANRVIWEDKPEFDFKVLENDLTTSKYYIDSKTTAKGIANSNNVPFYMRLAQWNFLENDLACNKYLIARVFKNGTSYNVRFLKIDILSL